MLTGSKPKVSGITVSRRLTKPVRQYLERYATSEAGLVQPLLESMNCTWTHCLVIPAYDETLTDLEAVTRLWPEPARQLTLQIWIINAPESGVAASVAATRQCLKEIRLHSIELAALENLTLRRFDFGDVLVVDRCSPGLQIDPAQGVGAARKIGGDLALALYASARIHTDWLCYTDADAELPPDYAEQLSRVPHTASALVFPHCHRLEGDADQQRAIAAYQFKLNAHVAGLQAAGSPYAYHTIGSLIACRLESYAVVRGMPARAGGEDFYFLNKLAKSGPVVTLEGEPVRLSGRASQRVPFGTGPAIRAALVAESRLQTGRVHGLSNAAIEQYHPLVYRVLKAWLEVAEGLWQTPSASDHPGSLTGAVLSEQWMQKLQGILGSNSPAILSGPDSKELQALDQVVNPENLSRWLTESGAAEQLSEIMRRSRDLAAYRRHFHIWFDAFRTLKFIHWWRDRGLASIPVEECQTGFLNEAGEEDEYAAER